MNPIELLFSHPLMLHGRESMKPDSVGDATYELVVRGELGERYAYLFEGMQMERSDGMTFIAGPVRDQAKLHSLIERIEELGLELISVQQVTASQQGSEHERDEA